MFLEYFWNVFAKINHCQSYFAGSNGLEFSMSEKQGRMDFEMYFGSSLIPRCLLIAALVEKYIKNLNRLQ